jgi:asparagine synthase (glutamine-hydrolysing)
LHARVVAMTDSIRHRGPDDSGVWVDSESGIGLGHRRLSILDLSAEGHQPMWSAGRSLVMVFNGEVYNFQELRKELEAAGYRFRGHSDTEIMLAAFEEWGVDASVRRFNGMFAFALWDRRKRTLYLCRDRMGKKPLYYGWAGDSLIFGSELKALRSFPGFAAEVDRNALALYMRLGYIPAPYTIWKGIHKLPAATYVAIGAKEPESSPKPVPYWSAAEAAEKGLQNQIGSFEEAIDGLDSLLRDAVALRMISDVPLGAFLSGGIDSSVVVALMQAQSTRPVKTFCIGFQEQTHNEAEHARAVAKHLGTSHTELILTPQEALAVVPQIPAMFDEPFADSSQIPTYLVSRLARQDVTVSLSGDGGDEMFAGYTAYRSSEQFYRKYGWAPQPLRSAAAVVMRQVPQDLWNRILPASEVATAGARIHKLASTFRQPDEATVYRNMMSYWEEPCRVVTGAEEPPTPFTNGVVSGMPTFTEKMMLLDSLVYLPDDILVKVDRASMAVSLEARGPLLDYRVFEYAWRIPLNLKQRENQGKWILRQLLYRYVPQQLVDRPKTGFAIPVASWLRGPLREWAGDLLDTTRLRRRGLLDANAVGRTWQEHLNGFDWSQRLWSVLMLESIS